MGKPSIILYLSYHKAMIDIGIQRRDSLIIRNSGVLFRSIASKAWEDRSTTLRQIDEVGQKSIKVRILDKGKKLNCF